MAGTKFSQVLQLYTLIATRRPMNVATLATELNVCKRTIHRHLKEMENSGFLCGFDREIGGYRVKSDYFLPPVNLTIGEAMALSVMASEIGRLKQMPFMEQAWQGMMKVRSQLPMSIQDELVKADKTVRIRTAAASAKTGAVEQLLQISNAITNRRKLQVVYPSAAGAELQPFLFHPYSLYFGQRAWYVIGFSERAGAERTLKLDRLCEVKTTDRPYGIPDGWSLERNFGKAWRMVRGERRYAVAIEFSGDFARTMSETIWHPTQKITWKSVSSCVFECDVDGLDEIVWWVLSYGPNAKVLRPPELVMRTQELFRAALQNYIGSLDADRSGQETEGPASRTPRTRNQVLA